MPRAGQMGDAWLGVASYCRDRLRALSDPTAVVRTSELTQAERDLAQGYYKENIARYEATAVATFDANGLGLAEPTVCKVGP